MVNDELYKLAAEYFKQKLWYEMSAYRMFGVQLEDGRIAYCSVNGRDEDEIYFSVYVGNEELDTYRNSTCRYEFFSENEDFWLSVSQKCLRVTFLEKDELFPEELAAEKKFSRKNKIYFREEGSHPRFSKYLPLQVAFSVEDEEDKKILALTLSAALEVRKKFPNNLPRGIKFENRPQFRRNFPLLTWTGENFKWSKKFFPPFRHLKYPSAKLTKKDAEKLRAAQKIQNYSCELFLLHNVKTDVDGFSKFIVVMLALNSESGERIKIEPDLNYLSAPEKLTKKIVKSFLKEGVPKKIFVRMERTYQFLEKFCEQAGIELCDAEELPEIENAEKSVNRYLKIRELQENEVFNRILDALENEPVKKLKKEFPADLKYFLLELVQEDILRPDIKDKILEIAETD